MICWKIIEAEFNPDYSIKVKFADGLSGVVRINPTKLIRVFKPLKDVNLFVQGYLKYGAVMWKVVGGEYGDYELDMAPDTMYEEIKKNHGVYDFK